MVVINDNNYLCIYTDFSVLIGWPDGQLPLTPLRTDSYLIDYLSLVLEVKKKRTHFLKKISVPYTDYTLSTKNKKVIEITIFPLVPGKPFFFLLKHIQLMGIQEKNNVLF